MKVIELKDVKKSYGKNEILHGISLDIEEGSIHGLVGRNGCGKTTLIKCLTGIYEQDQGQILVCGEEIFENPKVKAQVGYVADSNQYFEGYPIPPNPDRSHVSGLLSSLHHTLHNEAHLISLLNLS